MPDPGGPAVSGDHTKREVTVTRIEYAVPSGADIKDFGLVEEWAWQDCARRNGWDPKGTRYDNWCTVVAHDDEVVFAFTVEAISGGFDPTRSFVDADLAQCKIERDSYMRQAESLNDALGRVRTLLAHMGSIDSQSVSDWPKLVRDAIEGQS
jgi:hypothetical protein